MSLGLALLGKLGLKDEAIAEKSKPKQEKMYSRDQTGLGYTRTAPDFLKASEEAFAKLQAAATVPVVDDDDSPAKLTVKPAQQRVFIPARLRKRSIGSLSNEDIAHVLSNDRPTPVDLDAVKVCDPEPQRRRRRRHHRTEGENEVSTEVSTEVTDEVADE